VVYRGPGVAVGLELTQRAYRAAPDITRRRLYIETMQEIYERLKRVTLVDPSVKGMLPVFTPTGVSEEKRP
jgi:membrane protease subunit HflK